MKKVPNIVFLIIAIIGLAAAGIMFSMYSSEKEMSANSLNKISELEKDVNNLMNKNSDLMMQMSGVEDQKKKLEEKITAEDIKCNSDECLMSASFDPVFGLAKIKGYYIEEEMEDFDIVTEETFPSLCDRFVITSGPDKLINDYLEQDFSAFDKNDNGEPIINIWRKGLKDDEWNEITKSDIDNPIELTIFDAYLPPTGFEGSSFCMSVIDILKVN